MTKFCRSTNRRTRTSSNCKFRFGLSLGFAYSTPNQIPPSFQRPDIVEQLVTMIITEPPGDVPDAVRFKHPNVACEILTTETPDMTERLIENEPVLQKLYSFLEQDAPLNPLLTSFFSKTFGMLIVKKTEQNWFAYQCVCIQVLEFIKTRERFLETMFKHVGTPAIMDLLFQIIVNVEGPDLKNNLFNVSEMQNLAMLFLSKCITQYWRNSG